MTEVLLTYDPLAEVLLTFVIVGLIVTPIATALCAIQSALLPFSLAAFIAAVCIVWRA